MNNPMAGTDPTGYMSDIEKIDVTEVKTEKVAVKGSRIKRDRITKVTGTVTTSNGAKNFTANTFAEVNIVDLPAGGGTNRDSSGGFGESDFENQVANMTLPSESGSNSKPSGEKNNPAFDVTKAVTELDKNAGSKSTGYCAKNIRLALEAGGMKISLSERPGKAVGYSDLLESKGLTTVDVKDYVPIKGDIVVIQPYKAQSSQAGHIQMFNGSRWVSDFNQRYDNSKNRVNNLYPGPSYRNEKVDYEIYRP
jgi:hypothetical protein